MNAKYVAGLVDGEGCIYLIRSSKQPLTFAARMDMGMTDPAKDLLSSLHQEYGGGLSQTRQASKKWAAAWRWHVQGEDCINLLKEVGPYLMLKEQQASLVIRFQRQKRDLPRHINGAAKWTEQFRNEAAALKEQIERLNQKGPRREMRGGWIARHVAGYWLTPQQNLFGVQRSTLFSGRFPKSGTMRNGHVYPLPESEHRTSANVFSSSPSAETCSERWPTPTAWDGKRGARKPDGKRGMALSDLPKAHLWPTPTAGAAKQSNRYPRGNPTLKGVAGKAREELSGKLNPNLCRWLMGFPTGWTAFEDSETR